MSFRKLASLILVAATSTTGWAASGVSAGRASTVQTVLTKREQQVWTGSVHNSNFATMAPAALPSSCEPVQFPVALATPDPLLDEAVASDKVTVSFIVGTDGRVHSPLILESRGPSEDRIVLDAVRAWRYRPATCNGVPTEVEAKIAFSGR